MDIEVNDNKQQASFRNGKFYHTFTPTIANQTVKLYHMGCVGDTRLNRIQLEQGTEPTGFVAPKHNTNTLSGIFKNLRDLDVKMTDPDSDLWTRIKKTARGTIEEYHTNTLSNEIVRTAEGIVERQTKTINSSVDEKIDGVRTQIDTVMNNRVIALTSESKRYADGISETLTRKIDGVTNSVATVTRNVDGVSSNLSRINSELARTISNVDQKADRISNSVTTLENNSLRKDEVSITSTGIQLGSGKVIDGRTITSLITTQPENIKAITDKFIITPANENLVDFEYRASAVSNERDLWLTSKIQDVNLEQGAEFIFDGSVSTRTLNRHDIRFMIEIKTKNGYLRWYDTNLIRANTLSSFNGNATLRIPENISDIEYYRFGILQETRSNFSTVNIQLPKIYKKKSAELIVEGSIEGRHIKSTSLETGHFKAGSVTSDIIAAKAVKGKHMEIDAGLINDLVSHNAFVTKLWAQKAFINKLNAIKISATQLDTDWLSAYTGEIGGFRIGHNPNDNDFWLTGANNFECGINPGLNAGTRGAQIWAAWGNNWTVPGPNAWRVNAQGEMHCNATPTFYKGMEVYGRYIDTHGNDIQGDASGGKTTVIWWSQINRVRSSVSDRRFKTNIKPTKVKALDLLNKIEMVEFNWKKDNKFEKIGAIAQQVQSVEKSLVVKDMDSKQTQSDYLRISYYDTIPYLIKAVQELSQQNKELQQRIIKMEEKING